MRRRTYLITVGATIALAGCTGDDDGNGSGDQTSTDEPTATGTATETEEPTATTSATATESPTDTPTTTSAPTATETPTPTPPPAPEDQEFSDSGQTVESGIDIEGGLTILVAEHDGSSNFIVELISESGGFSELFVNKIGVYDGAGAALFEGGQYRMDVTADGNWSIVISQPRPSSGTGVPIENSGEGPDVLGPVELDGLHTVSGEHDGERNFIVEIYPIQGRFSELAFNEIGSFNGETTVEFDGLGYIDIEADGSWTLEIE